MAFRAHWDNLNTAASGACGDDDDAFLLRPLDRFIFSVTHRTCAIAVNNNALDAAMYSGVDHIPGRFGIGIETSTGGNSDSEAVEG